MLIFLSLLDREEDKSTFQKIYEKNCMLMMHVAMKILGQQQEAEDAVYGAFLSLAEHYSGYRKRNAEEMRALCLIITKNKAIDILREKRHLCDEAIEALNLQESKEDGQPENVVIGQEQADVVRRALLELPEILKCVLELKYYLEYNNREIAGILGIPLKTVEMRLYRGKKKLREVLENETG